MQPVEVIRRCIARTAQGKDGRASWQNERACASALGGSAIDRNAAAAARRLGEWLRTAGKR